MELSRRDALAALAALGTASASAGCAAEGPRAVDEGSEAVDEGPGGSDAGPGSSDAGPGSSDAGPGKASGGVESVVDTYVAVAAVVYPSDVDGVEPFVRSFVGPRLDRAAHGEVMRTTVAELRGVAADWYGEDVAAMDPETRDRLLREVGADTADEDPDGTLAERVRFYVVNELLLGLYASPTGGELVGIENPQGHAGGTDSYQRGPL